MTELLQENALLIGLVLSGLGVLRMIYIYSVISNQEPINAPIIDIKRKTRKGRQYTYPVVEVGEAGIKEKVYCRSARKRGHTFYDGMESIEMYRCLNLLFQHTHIAKKGFLLKESSILIAGIFIIVFSVVL